MTAYRTSFKSASEIIEHLPTHIQVHEKLIVRRDYIKEFHETLRVVVFFDGTAEYCDDDCAHDIAEELRRRKDKYGRKKRK